MAVKNIVVSVECGYLEEAAKVRGISRTRLAQTVMEKIVSERLVRSVLGDDDRPMIVPKVKRYRRFAPKD